MPETLYNDNLTSKTGDIRFDIVKVYAQNEGKYIDGNVLSEDKEAFFDLIWERKVKEMTISEIEKELGYSIKIINENKEK